MSYIGKDKQVALYYSYTREQTDGLIDQGIIDAFSGSNSQLQSQGYQILPNGLIIQWGSGNVSTDGTSTIVYYPIPFPSIPFSCGVIYRNTAATNVAAYGNVEQLTDSLRFNEVVRSDGRDGGMTAEFIAIGY